MTIDNFIRDVSNLSEELVVKLDLLGELQPK